VARHLAALGLHIEHIHADGRLESQTAALSRLARTLKLPEEDMFHSREELLDEVYGRQEARIAHDLSHADAVQAGSVAG